MTEIAIGSALVAYLLTNFTLTYLELGMGDGSNRILPSLIMALGVALIIFNL